MNVKFILKFLSDLKKNNNREWFNEHKTVYTEAKGQFETFVDTLIPEVAKFDNDVMRLTAKDCLFRIYNDTRFYKNKPPYKINMGAFIAKGGKNSGSAGYYFHLEPGSCFLGGGIYMPQSERLKLIRQEIYFKLDTFISIIENKNFKKYFGTIEGEKTSRVPKDFPKDYKGAEWLKYKSYSVLYPMKPELLAEKELMKTVLGVFSQLTPLNHFLNTALTN
ncbi:MAG TPA: DUF2461 domain-containing protein [Bacteroidales bacterium]|nr:DUF2461 domain-containing protein [Bacteroidales bacterium]HPS16060.1 DUF2461 domain-containing protein [Bacteroidales bacterium]